MKKLYRLSLTAGILLGILSFFSYAFSSKTYLTGNDLIKKIQTMLDQYNSILPDERIYLQLDKPFYEPGDDIWFKAYLRNSDDLKPSSTSGILYVELINPKGNVDKTLRLVALNGTAVGDFKIEEGMAGGLYKIKAYTNWMAQSDQFFEKELQVQAVVYPRLLMKIDFEKKAYGPGDRVVAALNLNTLSNQPLKDHNFNFVAQLEGKELTKSKSKTNNEGEAYLSFELPKDLETNDGLLNVIISYEGNQESISRSIPIVLNNVDLQFFPEGGDMIAGIASKVAFKALNEFGEPADIEGVITDNDGQIVTKFASYHLGMGSFEFTPDPSKNYQVKLTNPEGVSTQYTLPKALAKGYRLSIESNKEEISASINAPFKSTVVVIAQVRGKIYFSKALKVKEGENTLSIPTNSFPAGIAQVTVFDEKEIARCERLAFVNAHKQMNVSISTDKEKYLPRELVEMFVKVSDENGLPVPANLSVSVVDDKVISFADDKQANIMASLLLQSDLKGEIEEPNFYFDPTEEKATKALDFLLMTQGWRRFEWKDILEKDASALAEMVSDTPEKAVVRGKVVNTISKKPVAGLKVTVLETEQQVNTDGDGNFVFTDLDLTSPVTLQIIDNEGNERLVQVNDYNGEYRAEDVIRGKVLQYGTPLANVKVWYPETEISTTTDEKGEFIIQRLFDKSELYASNGDYAEQIAQITGRQHVTFNFEEDVWLWEEAMEVDGFGAEPAAFAPADEGALGVVARAGAVNEEPAPVKEDNLEEVVIEEIVFEAKAAKPAEPADFDGGFMEVADDWEWGEEEDIAMDFLLEAPREDVIPDVFSIVETSPRPVDGMDALHEQIKQEMVYPQSALRMSVEGRVFVQFVVDENGNIQDVQVIKGLTQDLDQEALRLVNSFGTWVPGKQRENPVKTRMVMPINFRINDYTSTSSLMYDFGNSRKINLGAQRSLFHRARTYYVPKYQADEIVETRTDFRKTIYWNPEVVVDKTGETILTFHNSDEVTSFRTIVEGIADEGLVGRGECKHFTQLPFSLDTKLPAVIAFEDRLSLPITLKNNTEETIKGEVSLELPEGFKLIGEWDPKVRIEANSVYTKTFEYEILPIAGESKFKVSFEAQGLSDSFEQPVEIKSKGFPSSQSFSGADLDATFNLEIRDMVKQSMTARLTAYPNVLSDLMAGIESILREPYGCFEQTSSSTYPNILAMQYMEESGTINPEISQRALDLIDKGYKKLTAYETADKGYEWFGSTPPHEALTAYGLMEFKDMQHVYASVDNQMIDRTTAWLMSRRDGNGGFKKSPQALDDFGRASEEVTNAYIVYALSEADFSEMDKELDMAFSKADDSEDIYQMALVTNALFNLGKTKRAEQMLKKMLQSIEKTGFENMKMDHSITRSYGISLKVETASLVVMAILKSKEPNVGMLENGARVIMESRGGYGGFGSTQSTIMALKALTQYAHYSRKTETSGTIEIYVDGKKIASRFYEQGTKGDIVIQGLEAYLGNGNQKIQVKFKDTEDALPYSIDVSWNTYTPVSDKECMVDLKTQLSSQKIKMGETTRLSATLTNTTDEGLPMTMVLLGIPSGMSAQPWQLKELMEKNQVDFYEVEKNYVAIYYRQMKPNEVREINLDLKSELAGEFEAPANSAYLYYTNEYKTWTGGERVTINE